MWTVFIVLAAFLNAVMDIVENENFSSSVFRNRNPKWWYKRESWKYARKIFGWKYDAWHVAKSSMLILWALALVTYKSLFGLADIVLVGILWNVTFNISYRVLKWKDI